MCRKTITLVTLLHLQAAAILCSDVQPSVGSWCVASKSAAKAALQAALDYACGYSGGVDCSAIQPGGGCYWPAAVGDHASYAFNSYYQKNPIPSSCNFGGSAVTTSTDPSYGSCKYPSISITSSELNITNSSGSRVFGAGPVTPSTSAAAALLRLDYTSVTCIIIIWYSLLFLPLVKLV